MNLGPELSRSFRAFKIWCSLRVFGVSAFVEAVEHTLDVARHFERRLQDSGVFEVMTPVTLNAVCFRVKDRSDAFQQEIVDRLRDGNVAFLGAVRLAGSLAIRACVTNFRTSMLDIDDVVERLAALVTS